MIQDTEYCPICQARMLYLPRREYAKDTNAAGMKVGPYKLVLDHVFFICPNACILVGQNRKTGSSHQLYLPALIISADERKANQKEMSDAKHERPARPSDALTRATNGAASRVDERGTDEHRG